MVRLAIARPTRGRRSRPFFANISSRTNPSPRDGRGRARPSPRPRSRTRARAPRPTGRRDPPREERPRATPPVSILPPPAVDDRRRRRVRTSSFFFFVGIASERANRASLQNDRAEKVAERGVRAVRQGDRHKLREDVQAAGTSLGGVRHRHRRDERGATNERLSVLRQTHARRLRANEIRRHRKGGGHVRPGRAGSRGAAEAQGGVPGARKAEPSREEGERREKRRRRRGGGRRRVQRGDDAAQRDSLRAGVAGYAFFSSRNPRASLLSAARRVPFLSYSPVAVR